MPKRCEDADKLIELIKPVNDLIDRAANDLDHIHRLKIEKNDIEEIWEMVRTLTRMSAALSRIEILNKS
jgi:gamma-glutamylcysteine synthetase